MSSELILDILNTLQQFVSLYSQRVDKIESNHEESSLFRSLAIVTFNQLICTLIHKRQITTNLDARLDAKIEEVTNLIHGFFGTNPFLD